MSEVRKWKLKSNLSPVYLSKIAKVLPFEEVEKRPFQLFYLSHIQQFCTVRNNLLKYTSFDMGEGSQRKGCVSYFFGRQPQRSGFITADYMYDILRGHFSINLTQDALSAYLNKRLRLLTMNKLKWMMHVDLLEELEPCLPIHRK